MSLNAKAIKRLARLGYKSEADLYPWLKIWHFDGETCFWSFLESTEGAAEEYRLWFPRLKAFEAECRRVSPVPAMADFSSAERAQYQILLTRLREYASSREGRFLLTESRHRTLILSLPRFGLAAPYAVMDRSKVAVLEETESQRWAYDIYKTKCELFSWYEHASWSIGEKSDPDKYEISVCDEYPIPQGSVYWFETWCSFAGDLAGSIEYNLWSWNGECAQFIINYALDTF